MKKWFSIALNSLHFVASAVILFLVTYFFGYILLRGGTLGNDASNTYAFVVWLDKFYPRIPLWFPLEGTGVSFVQGYQVIPELLVVWIHHFTSLSLIQIYELLSFLSVYFSALGAYILGWTRLKSKTIGLIAGTFFLLAPVTWVWTAQAGFFASAVSLAFFPPAFIFADMYADYVFGKKQGKGKYITFSITVIFLSLALLMHFTTFMALFIVLFLYLSLFGLIRNRNIFDNFKKIFVAIVPPFAVSVLLSAFWFVPFYLYNNATNWDLSAVPNPDAFPKININAFLSIPTHTFYVGSVWAFSFPLFVWVLALLAIPIAFFYSRKLLSLTLVGAFCLYGSVSIGIYVFASKISGFLASGFSPRIFWIIYNFFGPILAAFAIVGGVNLLVKLPVKMLLVQERTKALTRVCTNFFLVPVISFGVALFVIVVFRSVDLDGAHSFAHYGTTANYPYLFINYEKGEIYGGGLDLRDIWQVSMLEDLNYLVFLKSSSGQLTIGNLSTKSQKSYPLIATTVGGPAYKDRKYILASIPDFLKGAKQLQTYNGDKDFANADFLQFTISNPADMYVAYDSRAVKVPDFLSKHFQKLTQVVTLIGQNDTKIRMNLYKLSVSPGKVVLGGNLAAPAIGIALRVTVPTVKNGHASYQCTYEVDKTIADLCEQKGFTASWGSLFQQLSPQNWPSFTLSKQISQSDSPANVLSSFPPSDNLRIDISPNAFGALLSQFPIYRQDLSILNTYTFQLSLNHIFWGLSQGVFYSYGAPLLYRNADTLNQFSDYFGTHAIVLGSNDPLDKYKQDGWKLTGNKDNNYVVAVPPKTYPLVDVNTKPSVLLIGQQKYTAYETLFRSAVLGAIPFDSAYIVMGKSSPVEYSLDELKKFDAVVLFAYGPKSGSDSWKRLKQYVEEGGSLYVDTGWQYVVPDWQLQNAYDVLPTNNLEWKNLPTNGQYETSLKDVNASVLSPLVWNGGSWGVSTSKSLKDWARPVLSYGGYPLVAEGNFGSGKVVWSGMNLFSHSLSNENIEEIHLEKDLFSYLLSGKTTTNFPIIMQRSFPDKVTFTVNSDTPDNSNIYFREAYIANWQAYVVHNNQKQNIQLYRGGPGLLFAKLPALRKGDQIIFSYQFTAFEQVAYILSLFTLLCLFAYSIDHLFLEKKLTSKLTGSVHRIVLSRTEKVKQGIKQGTESTLKSFWDEDS